MSKPPNSKTASNRAANNRAAEKRTAKVAPPKAETGRCASPRRWRVPGSARVARPSVGSPTAASASTASCSKRPPSKSAPNDKVFVDGRPLPTAEPPQLWRYHKPRGIVTTHSDPEGRPTVFEKMPPEMPRVISVGRLDFNTEGLLLLTNDGALARHMELPANGWVRRYRVRAKGRVTPTDLTNLKDGLEIDGVLYGPIEASVDSVQGANTWLSIAIREGKNREVRNVLAHLGLVVNRLIRVSFGPFQLLDLAPGAVEAVRRRVLVAQLGPKASEALGFSESQAERKARHARGKAASEADDA